MSFFTELDTTSLLEDNAEQLRNVERETAIKMMQILKRTGVAVSKKRSQFGEDTFTAQQARVIELLVDSSLAQIFEMLGPMATSAFRLIAGMGVEHLEKEVNFFDEKFTGAIQPLNLNALEIATDTSTFNINQFASSMARYSQGLRLRMSETLGDSIAKRQTMGQTVEDIGSFFDADTWRLNRIVRTELHQTYGAAKILGMQRAQVPLKKTLFHPMDSRTSKDSQFLASHAKEMIKLPDEPFEYWWSYKSGGSFDGPLDDKARHRVFQVTDRPNDRAIVIPYRDDWN